MGDIFRVFFRGGVRCIAALGVRCIARSRVRCIAGPASDASPFWASGALPFWVDTAQAIADRDLIGSLSKEVPWRPQEPLHALPTKLEYLKRGTLRVEEAENWFYSEDNDYLERNLYRLYAPVNAKRTILKQEPFRMKDKDLEEEVEESGLD